MQERVTFELETGFIQADEIETGVIDDADGELAALTDALVTMLSASGDQS